MCEISPKAITIPAGEIRPIPRVIADVTIVSIVENPTGSEGLILFTFKDSLNHITQKITNYPVNNPCNIIIHGNEISVFNCGVTGGSVVIDVI
jgi:hypothetical protein